MENRDEMEVPGGKLQRCSTDYDGFSRMLRRQGRGRKAGGDGGWTRADGERGEKDSGWREGHCRRGDGVRGGHYDDQQRGAICHDECIQAARVPRGG